MEKHFRILAIVLVMVLPILACSSSFQFVGDSSEDLLPHALYYLADGQIFRMEKDGKTITQITHEPAGVTDYDVSLADGSIAYEAGSQFLLANADGSNRRMLVDGYNGSALRGFYNPVFSPDGKTLAYSWNGLYLYDLSTGISILAIPDHPLDGPLSPEIYLPEKFSPDGTKLLVTIGFPPDGPPTAAIYSPDTKVLMQFASGDESLSCCTQYGGAEWSADSSSFYTVATVLDSSSPFGVLWKVNANAGAVTTLIPGNAGAETNVRFNLLYKPYLAPDGHLYFFFLNYPEAAGYSRRAPLQLVRSASDGVTNWTVLRPDDTFELMNEALWAPDASFVVVAFAPNEDEYDGGQAEIVYLDGRSNVVLTPFAQQLKWGS